jgi:tetratricopeptide (TPR) repeat protein
VNPQELGLLINALRNKEQGLFLVEVDGTDTLNDLLLKLKVAAGQAGKRLATLSFTGFSAGKTVANYIEQQGVLLDGVQIVCLSNFISPLQNDASTHVFRLLNQAREYFQRQGKNWLFLLSPAEHTALRVHARDLYSWIPQRFVLHGGIASPREFSHALRMQENLRFHGDKDRAYLGELIALYEAQLQVAPEDQKYRITKIVTPLADLYKESEQYEQELPLRREILDFWQDQGETQALGRGLNNYATCLCRLPVGDRTENLYLAISIYQEALVLFAKKSYRFEYAMIQNNLGCAYAGLPMGYLVENLPQAINAYQEALSIYTKEAFPVQYAMTQNNLGNAYADLHAGDRAENLRQAIAAYQQTLIIYTKEAFPIQYATTRYNLGSVYENIPGGDRFENLQKAISAYLDALTILTKETFPVQYAEIQNNLGNAYESLPVGDRVENLKKSLISYQEALCIFTKEAFPQQHDTVSGRLEKAQELLRGLEAP